MIRAFVYPFAFVIQIIRVFFLTLWEVWKNREKGKALVFEEVIKQVYFTGVQAFWLISMFAAIIGLGAGIQISFLLSSVGNPELVDKVFFRSVILELAPLTTAIIVLGRSGSAVAVELATLVYNEEINTYRALGINIFRFLIYPRLLGITFATIVLSVYFAVITISVEALLIYFQAGVPLPIYLGRIQDELSLSMLASFIIKNMGNGILITTICCIKGLEIIPSLTEIPRAVSRAMVHSLFAVIVFSAVMAMFLYML
ncbi:MAG: ABC transporter permease [Planctomycetes bacterium]|nr:ABC transporter permease [Planctomycetota bacterium]